MWRGLLPYKSIFEYMQILIMKSNDHIAYLSPPTLNLTLFGGLLCCFCQAAMREHPRALLLNVLSQLSVNAPGLCVCMNGGCMCWSEAPGTRGMGIMSLKTMNWKKFREGMNGKSPPPWRPCSTVPTTTIRHTCFIKINPRLCKYQ
jgi:hypothetical protein